ncbi:MAG TPA: hypothetical protein VFQ36_04100 [Ktedonobacteraceae bacterium]|nr:hypothetical protein [Ktedonobacteraceae bacterium]
MTPVLTLRDWQNFYMLTGAAAATLIGLLFVAISISVGTNLSIKQARNSLRTFVNPILVYYSQVFIISCLAIMPLQSINILGGVVVVLGGLNIFLALKICWRILVLHRDEMELGHWIWHFFLPLITSILYVCTAIGFFNGAQLAAPGLSVADLLCLAIGLRNTWVLTLWLVMHQGPRGDTVPERQANSADSESLIG